MIGKIIPQIFNGNWQLMVSETLSCVPSRGLQVYIPITNEKNAIFNFVFKAADDQKRRNVSVDQVDNNLTFTLTNFLSSLGASLSNPFNFSIGKDKFLLQLYGLSTGGDILCLTISLFKEKNA